jgi:hypothetical protein
MTAVQRLRQRGLGPDVPLRVLAASGQLGYGIPEAAFLAGLERDPHFIGCDMGSVDPGPYYLGSGKLATSERITKRDLKMVLTGALKIGVPLIIGTAGTAGAQPHLERTLEIVREIAREENLSFKLAVIESDLSRDVVKRAVKAGTVRPLGRIDDLTDQSVDNCTHLVGQLGVDAIIRALETNPDVIITGRACDTAVFAAVPFWLGYDKAAAMHMAKIIECTSICCVPGGRDAMLGTLEDKSFLLESMNPDRAATPLSVAAHSLYEQSDPFTVYEPEGVLRLEEALFEAVDERRTRVRGAIWTEAQTKSVKMEGAEWCGERTVLCAGSCDPRVIESTDEIIAGVKKNVASIVGDDAGSYELIFHVYGKGAVTLFEGSAGSGAHSPEIFFLVECIAPDLDDAKAVITVTKQYLLHHGFNGRLSTGGNIAFPFTPPELTSGSAYKFTVYHVMDFSDDDGLFPLRTEDVAFSS